MKDSIDNYKKRIADLKEAVDKAKEERIRNETNLEQAMAKKAEVVKKIEELGLTPENLKEEIEKKEKTLEGILSKLESELLPALNTHKDVMF